MPLRVEAARTYIDRMMILRDFAVAAVITVFPVWLLLGAGAIPFAVFAGVLVAWDNARRRQIASGGSMK